MACLLGACGSGQMRNHDEAQSEELGARTGQKAATPRLVYGKRGSALRHSQVIARAAAR
eukprot:CAMPEP_0197397762 /NCGR_PEP_ID=MMETSP1165-20131217/12090_1 /TAXON_ID=284809 /ORGANISM="Chrysocystis fragilis, Strain CCMP3189" /LENGTH=58 /DNA_ID=CAMNT_0042923675 /DNA_START=144 /DNA_END=317 /DNA_ORIENTATION=-